MKVEVKEYLDSNGMMSSKKIAEITGKNHDAILKDVIPLLATLSLDSDNPDFVAPNFEIIMKDDAPDEVLLNEDLAKTLIWVYKITRTIHE